MPKFNPAAIVEDIDNQPMKFGTVDDPVARKEMTRLRGELAKQAKDAPEKVPALEEELMVLITDNQRNLTLGAAVVTALRSALKEDENLSESVKLDHMEWAVKVRAAENALASVEFSNEHMARIKDRVNKCFPAPEVVWRLDQALKADKPTLVKTA